MCELILGITTFETREEALKLANSLIAQDLAVCVQLEGPILSLYKWKGKVEMSEEYRLLVKYPKKILDEVEAFVIEQHPYDVPEWISLDISHVSEGYLEWARGNNENI